MTTINGEFLNYDFTTSASQAFCGNMKACGCKSYIFNGDMDGDGFIGITDYDLVLTDAFPVQCSAPLGLGGSTTNGSPTGGLPSDLTNDNPLHVDCIDVCLIDETVYWIPLMDNNPGNLINRPTLFGAPYSTQCIINPDICTCSR